MRGDSEFCQRTTAAVADYLWQELQIHPRRGDYRVAALTSGPRVFAISLAVNPKYAPRIIGLSEQLSMAAGLDHNAKIRVARGNQGTLALEVPKPEGLRRPVPVRALPRRHGLRVAIGLDTLHRPAVVDFSNSLTPHLLTAGTTGSGKTNAARLFVFDLAAQNDPADVRLVLIDTRKLGRAWQPFAALPHLAHPIIADEATALRALLWAAAEIDRRARSGQTRPAVFVAIDEAQALLTRPEFVAAVGDIGGVGREFNIHLLLATQNPTADMMGSTAVKANMGLRLVGKVDSAANAVIAAGVKGSGAELLTGSGDQLLIGPDGIARITVALLTERDINALPASERTIDQLDLSEYEDADRVLAQAENGARTILPKPAHVALALATGRGINWLARQLRIGAKAATRAKEYADELWGELEALEAQGYTPIPHTRLGASGDVTILDDDERV